jgi:hypothetical protein
MIIGIPYNKKNMLPLVEGIMVDYHTQKTNITLDLSRGPVASLGHIILIPSQPVFAPYCQVFSVEATYNIFIVFGHTRP